MPVISCVSVLSVLGYLQAMSRQRMEHLPRHRHCQWISCRQATRQHSGNLQQRDRAQHMTCQLGEPFGPQHLSMWWHGETARLLTMDRLGKDTTWVVTVLVVTRSLLLYCRGSTSQCMTHPARRHTHQEAAAGCSSKQFAGRMGSSLGTTRKARWGSVTAAGRGMAILTPSTIVQSSRKVSMGLLQTRPLVGMAHHRRRLQKQAV